KAWPVRSAQCRPPSPPPPASPPASKAAPRRADRRPSPSAGSPARPRNTTEKPSSPSPPRQPRPLPSSTHPPPESEDHDRFSSSSICHANFQSIALAHPVESVDERNEDGVDEDDDREIKRAAQGERAEERQAPQRNAGRAAQCDFEPRDRSPVDPADHGAGKGVVVRNIAVDRPGERAAGGNPDDRSCRRVEPHRRIIERINGHGLPRLA